MARRTVSHEIVGRLTERALLDGTLHELALRRPSTLLISGEAGIGKSRLLSALRDTARDRGIRVLVGHCLNLETALPFAPLVEALRGLLAEHTTVRLADVAGASAPQLARLLPELRTVVEPGGTEDRLALFSALADVLTKVSADRPTILAVEDVHWSDASTRDAISYLTRTVQSPIATVLTCRDTDLGPRAAGWLEELVRGVRPERLDLGPLDAADVGDLVESITGTRPGTRELENLTRRTSGNPFFIEEVLGAEGELPVGLLELLRTRIDRLDASARRLVDAAAVGGSPSVDVEALAQVTGTEPDELPHHLRAVVDGGVFEVRASDDRYVFRHGLLAEAALTALIPDERVTWHRAWAEVLEDRGTRNPQVLGAIAHHWEEAREPDRALPVALAAAEAAEAVFAYPEAALQYERALRLWPEDDRDLEPDHVTVLERAGIAFAFGAEMSRGTMLLHQAIAGIDDPVRAALLYDRIGEFHQFSGEEQAAWEAHSRALELIPAQPPTPEAARVRASAAYMVYSADRIERSRQLADEAVRIAEEAGAPGDRARALGIRATIVSTLGDHEQAESDLREAKVAARLADAAGHEEPSQVQERRLQLVTAEVVVLAERGDYEGGLEVARETAELARAAGTDYFEGLFADIYIVWFTFRLGRWSECAQVLAELDHPPGHAHNRAHAEWMRLDLEVATGRLDEAAQRVSRTAGQLHAMDLQARFDVARVHAEMELWRQRPAHALRVCVEPLRLPSRGGSDLRAVGLLATALRACADLRGQPDLEDDDLTPESLFDRLLAATASHDRGEVAAWRVTGQAELARAGGDHDPDVWDRAADVWSDLKVPYRTAYCRYRQAEAILHGGGRIAEARDLLANAHATTVDLGAVPLQREIEQLARRARLELDSPAAPEPPSEHADALAPFGLTAREREVLALLAEGCTNAEAARRLFVTEKTVEGHVSNVLRKLGAANRVEAATMFQRLSG